MASNIPADAIVPILKFLDWKEMVTISLVCKKWKEAANKEMTWKFFSEKMGLTKERISSSWKDVFRDFLHSKYAIITGGQGEHYGHLLAKELEKLGLKIDCINSTYSTPSLQTLLQYQAVLIYRVDKYSFASGNNLGDTIYEYVVEHGKGAVVCIFSDCDDTEGLLAGRISPLLPHQPTLDIGCSRLRAAVIEISKFEAQNHPSLNGVKKVTYCNPKLSIEELSPQSRRIASWPCNIPMVTERLGEKGKIIGLNMFPVPALPASEWEYNVWDVNTDGYVLFSSCLKYANPLMARYKWN